MKFFTIGDIDLIDFRHGSNVARAKILIPCMTGRSLKPAY